MKMDPLQKNRLRAGLYVTPCLVVFMAGTQMSLWTTLCEGLFHGVPGFDVLLCCCFLVLIAPGQTRALDPFLLVLVLSLESLTSALQSSFTGSFGCSPSLSLPLYLSEERKTQSVIFDTDFEMIMCVLLCRLRSRRDPKETLEANVNTSSPTRGRLL